MVVRFCYRKSGDSEWKDLLTGYGSKTITYDAQGNPTNYLGNALTWSKGRQLKSFGTTTYTYNANGIRIGKVVDGVTHTYQVEGDKILCEQYGTTTITPIYDNEDSICGILYNEEPYFFVKNLQGDVIAITNKSAEVLARYTYDAWGKVLSVTDASGVEITASDHIAHQNPYRYRSYYYDTETELYYLQSRYYDPVVGRFVNADEPILLGAGENHLRYNFYVYVENDPVANVDLWGYVRINIKWLGTAVDVILWLIPALYTTSVIWKKVSKKANKLKSFGDKLITAGKKLFKRFDDRLYAAFAKSSTYRFVKTIGVLVGFASVFSSVGDIVQYLIDVLDGKWDGYLDTKRIRPKFDFSKDY